MPCKIRQKLHFNRQLKLPSKFPQNNDVLLQNLRISALSTTKKSHYKTENNSK